ncbi:NAD(P)H-hydrate dehydratase [Aquimarina brevivitae]|uniref:Bifunctional NAD(P)H-hydrate repair enzyme n=1 Tax=Aquimarina brevivitae TaxID=323412 RepID=A0A4Q7P201_9FLAO|nr:NAD(P)H-hydrate dehydratase [Aquimarina brevivitae]RZS93764.1 hydroxyethylthiazole kinase-like uncharacterized protein yjeF/hydroxyethylthiazole kinase-like uncharacterized protein yjeF [Aquimarina brevivitae]
MKILSANQLKEADQVTLENQQISSLDLMERAASQVFNSIHQKLKGAPILIHVFCGIGNNGGDGLVISRLLLEHGYTVKTYIVNFSEHRSPEFLDNYDRLKSMSKEWPIQLRSEEDFPKIARQDMVIDAIFGIGLNRPMVSWVVDLVKHINEARCFTLGVDVPSGLYSDKAPDDPNAVIVASTTVTFQSPKMVFFLPQTGKYTENFEVIDIGLDKDFLHQVNPQALLFHKREISTLYKPRPKFSHKGTYGHAVIIGGSYGKIGSTILASKAALRIGAGLVSAYVPECGYIPLQTSNPEVMVITDGEKNITTIDISISHNAIGIGMGLGTSDQTTTAFIKFLEQNKSPLVIDADAINILAKNDNYKELIPENAILTPHPKELERLVGSWEHDFEKIEKAKAFSKKYHCILIIKGAYSIVVAGNNLYVNSTGNQGMATAGSGDVLTGVITGLIAQGYDPLQASIFGTYLHGRAGDIGASKKGYESLIAGDLITNLGNAYVDLFKREATKPEN